MKKKIILSLIALLIISATSYTGLWFFTKHKIETATKIAANNLQKHPNIKYVAYKLDISCFPFLCVKFSDAKVKTEQNFASAKNGFSIKAFEEKPFKHKIKNILKPTINIYKNQASFDIASTNLDNEQTINLNVNFDKLAINISKNNRNLMAKDSDIEISSAESAFLVALTLGSLDMYLESLNNPESKNIAFGYEISNLKVFAPKTQKIIKEIKHSSLKSGIKNMPNKITELLKTYKKGDTQFIIDTIQELVKYKTEFQIREFRAKTLEAQTEFKGFASINENFRASLNFDSYVKFFKEGSVFEQFLKAYNIGQNEHQVYYLNARTENDIITINKAIKFSAPNLSSANK